MPVLASLLRLRTAGLVALALGAQAAHAQASRVPVEGAPPALQDELRRLLPEQAAPDSLYEARRQAERAAETVATLLESEGYYAAEVEPVAEGVDTFSRRVRATPGPLFTIGDVRLAFEGARPEPEVEEGLDDIRSVLAIGEPARAQPIIDIGDALVRRLREAGYPDAQGEPVDALADGALQTLELEFRLRPGMRASFGDIVVSGAEATRPDYIRTLRPWEPGELYSPRKMDEFRARLAETGLFDAASAQLGASASGEMSRPVVVELTERPRHTIALGASWSTSDGYGVDGEWERRNLTGRGDSLSLQASVATLDSSLAATYARPNLGTYGRDLAVTAEIENLETDAFDQYGGGLTATIEEQLTPRFLASLGVEASYASIRDERSRARLQERREVYLLATALTGEYIGVRDILDPRNGVRARLAVEPGVTFGDSRIGFTRTIGEASLYGDLFGERLTAAVRGRLGSIFGPEGVPPERLFFAGGGGSVRGYEYQSLSPRNAAGALTGGRSLVETSAELRWRPGDRLGYVAFIDAGAAGEGVDPPFEEMRAGAGVGVRYYAGFGPLRADIAIPLDKREGDSDFQIYISIGQAF
jgi:translocation and assembly module TamA